MAIRLRELIRAVRACKTAAEERDVIAKESAALREAFKEQDPKYRHRNVAKLMYIHMLGYPTHFGQMEALKLIATNGFPEKRIGYLGLMILLDERQEVLMLVTNSLKMDLNHKNQYIVGLALAALGNICSAEMARDLAPDVEKLLESNNAYIRKKSALTALRIVKKVPELIESFADRAADLLNDKNHAVMLGGVSLMLQICELDASSIERYRRHVPQLCRVLKTLLQSGFSPEHDVGGITDPFLQVKTLRLLRLLGRNNADASDQMSDILAQVAANIDANRNAGNAILYECVQTIMGIEAIGGLRVLAVNILGKFLANKDNNIRYVALNTLSKVVAADTQAVQRHRVTIVDCVKDADVSIRKRALELVYALVNENNIKTLTRELLDYLCVSDSEFKPDLTAKICALIQRFAPDRRWHIDNLIQVMVQAGPYVKEEVCRAFIIVVTNTAELHGYSVRALYRALKENLENAETSLATCAVWGIGEFAELLVAGQGGPLMEGEPQLQLSDADVVNLLEAVLRRAKVDPAVKEYAITALMKLTARLHNQVARLQSIIQKNSSSSLLEVQQRCCEYLQLFKYERIRPQLLERMPPLDESFGKTADGVAPAATATTTSTLGVPQAPAPAKQVDDLLGLDLLGDIDTSAPPAAASAVNDLDQLLGGSLGVGSVMPAAAPAPASAMSGGAADLLDLLGGAPPPMAAAPVAPVDPLANLLGDMGAPTPLATPMATSPAFPSIPAFQKDGLTVTFAFSKAPGQPHLTTITATYTNAGAAPIADFSLQAAVPKFMQLKLDPPTGSLLPPFGAGSVSQTMHINNSMHGQKALVMRLRISYNLGGQPVLEQAEVSNFPPGL